MRVDQLEAKPYHKSHSRNGNGNKGSVHSTHTEYLLQSHGLHWWLTRPKSQECHWEERVR